MGGTATGRATGRAVSSATLGAWLVKARPDALPLPALVRTGFADLTTRCVRPSYRTGIVRAGQPVLLWVSGADRASPPGIHAQGVTTGPVEDGPDRPEDGSEPVMPVRLRAVEPYVPRDALLAHPALSRIEVLRMPAGSNPSWLDVAQYAALREAFPQVGPG